MKGGVLVSTVILTTMTHFGVVAVLVIKRQQANKCQQQLCIGSLIKSYRLGEVVVCGDFPSPVFAQTFIGALLERQI